MKMTLGQYYHTDSAVHRLDPRVKLMAVLALMIITFLLNHPAALALYAVGLAAVTAAAHIPVKTVLRSVRAVLMIAVFAFVVNVLTVHAGAVLVQWWGLSITAGGLWNGFKLALRLLYLIMTSSLLLTLTTTPIKIADGMERLMKPLEKLRFPAHEMAMMMSIALRFVPTLAEETDKIMKAQSSRGADYDTGSLMTRARGMVSMLVPLFVSAFKRADDLALAMEARCYRGGDGRTKLHPLAYSRRDLAAGVLFLMLAAGLLLAEYALPPFWNGL